MRACRHRAIPYSEIHTPVINETAQTLSVPTNIGERVVPFVRTATSGLVITPLISNGKVSRISDACCLTHFGSGLLVGYTYLDVDLARKIAGALGGLIDFTQHAEEVVAAGNKIMHDEYLGDWFRWAVRPLCFEHAKAVRA